MESGMRVIILYWLKEKEDFSKLKAAAEKIGTIPKVCDFRLSTPQAVPGDDLLDASFDLAMELSLKAESDFNDVFFAKEHMEAGAVFKEVVAKVKGYSMKG